MPPIRLSLSRRNIKIPFASHNEKSNGIFCFHIEQFLMPNEEKMQEEIAAEN